ncbi:uncharacterized protein LOC131648172 [Vicia villosa]|uniref:uncharacterized protein LOC131648172 n=1 Tax=Vicia villosa TaxID=3911 RepID=UPI00273C0670|nr:uncharacterized protein LOC131648172 [Vicia villosa]
MSAIMDNSFWCLGDSNSINVWFDNWCGSHFSLDIEAPNWIEDHKVNYIIVNGKCYKVIIRLSKAYNIIEVIWQPPPRNWIKLNCNGASISPSGILACGGIARDNDNSFLGTFASCLGVENSLITKLSGAILVIEFAYEKY